MYFFFLMEPFLGRKIIQFLFMRYQKNELEQKKKKWQSVCKDKFTHSRNNNRKRVYSGVLLLPCCLLNTAHTHTHKKIMRHETKSCHYIICFDTKRSYRHMFAPLFDLKFHVRGEWLWHFSLDSHEISLAIFLSFI